jgi:hypothetical protein
VGISSLTEYLRFCLSWKPDIADLAALRAARWEIDEMPKIDRGSAAETLVELYPLLLHRRSGS